jgi:hypothetical protein
MEVVSSDPVSILLGIIRRNYKKMMDARETFEVISNRMSVLDNPQELIAFLGQHLKPKELEKKQNGEVFTPPTLIQQKFDKLTLADPLIWSDPSRKFLDPANGIGNYPALAFHRLMDGLKDAIPNEANRKKHILENMLYMCELNMKNVEVSRKIFDPENHYALNLYQGSYLDLDPKKEWGVEKFDVIFGNPPYNAPGNGASGNTLLHLFVIKSVSHIKPNGYIVFVHPGGWRKPNTDKGRFNGLFKKLTEENQLLYLDINNFEKGKEVFNCGTRYDWYIMKACRPTSKTEIKDENGEVFTLDLKKYKWLPNSNIILTNKLLHNNIEEKCVIIQSMSAYEPRKSWMSDTENAKFKYSCIHATNKSGRRFMYSSTNTRGHFGIPKIIFGDSGISNPLIDIEGNFGMTQHAMGIQVYNIEEANYLVKALTSEKFSEYLKKSCMWSTFGIEWSMFKDFKRNFYKEFLDKIEDIHFPVLDNINTLVYTDPVAKPVAVDTTTQPDYKKMKVADLKQVCKDRNIKGITGKSKEELIKILTEPTLTVTPAEPTLTLEPAEPTFTPATLTLEPAEPSTKPDYTSMTRSQLLEECKKKNLKGISTKKKEELLKMLEA